MTKFENALARWRLKRVIKALDYAMDRGLRPAVRNFASSLEATALMTQGHKKDTTVMISVTRAELNEFIHYMTRLHSAKLSLWHRARIGLATLALSDIQVLGEAPQEFVDRELPKAKHAKDDKRIVTLNKR